MRVLLRGQHRQAASSHVAPSHVGHKCLCACAVPTRTRNSGGTRRTGGDQFPGKLAHQKIDWDEDVLVHGHATEQEKTISVPNALGLTHQNPD